MGNSSKVIAIVALLVAVVALAVGFATFSATLTIDNATAIVKTNDQFSPYVKYTSGTPTCYLSDDSNHTSIITTGYNAGTITNNTSWTGIIVPIVYDSTSQTFKEVTCEAQMENGSVYDAYLREISSSGTLDAESAVASGADAASSASVTMVKNNTTVTIDVNGDTAQITYNAAANKTSNFNDSNSYIPAISSSTAGTRTVKVKVNYSGTQSPDGDVRVLIPTISLIYKTQ